MSLVNKLLEVSGSNPVVPGFGAQTPGERLNEILTEGHNLFEKHHSDDKKLRELWESNNVHKQKIAALTSIMTENQRRCLEGLVRYFGEATVMSTLGALTPKVMDVVRIFYPNQVAHILTDIQPLTQQTGQIFTIKPVYSQSAGGVTAGQEVFKNMTDGTYASEMYTASLGTANGSTTNFTQVLTAPVRKDGSLKVKRAGTVVATDNGTGVFTGTDGAATVTATIDYVTGVLSVTWSAAPASGAITADYLVDTEVNVSQIRELEIKLEMQPVRAQEHPLKVKWSVTAQMAASAHLGLDVPDILSTLAAEFVKTERDRQIVTQIANAAATDTNLNFDAAASSNYPKWQKFQELESKLTYGESAIQNANGNRGGVSWILAGYNASDIWSHVRGFVKEPLTNPIGAHRLGTLRDGTVDVIKAPFLDTNTYVIGFKGYMPGDSASILAEWIPMYFTPIFNSPDLQGQRGVMSLYDLFINVAGYFRKGTISNYVA